MHFGSKVDDFALPYIKSSSIVFFYFNVFSSSSRNGCKTIADICFRCIELCQCMQCICDEHCLFLNSWFVFILRLFSKRRKAWYFYLRCVYSPSLHNEKSWHVISVLAGKQFLIRNADFLKFDLSIQSCKPTIGNITTSHFFYICTS